MAMDRYIFRGKRLDNGEWVYGSLLNSDSREPYITDDHYEQITNGQWHLRANIADEAHRVDPATIGQCTGQKDKRGNLIYEGDVIHIDNDSWTVDNAVWWDDYYCQFTTGAQYSETHIGFEDLAPQDMNIIGNIHDPC